MRPAGWETLALSQFIGQDWELTNNVGSAIGLAGAAILKTFLRLINFPLSCDAGLGVPAACLPTFFDAVDLHMQRLEDDIIYHVNQEFSTKIHAK